MQRISQGEAQAMFQTGFTGGLHGRGAPSDPHQQVVIKPWFKNGRHYCAEDWHAILLGISIDEAMVGVTSVGEAAELFAPTVMTFVMDGKPFETTRLPVKPLLNDDPGRAFGLVQGRAVGPGELAAGSHTFSVTVENDPDPKFSKTYTYTSKFVFDAAGTGACT
jgi:hypothetical protein